ncbi:unnamed protein product, partial [marine sediment metagenome]
GKTLLSRPLTLQIIGVYEDPPEIQRRAYATADALIPITAAVSGFTELKGRRKGIERYLYTTVQVKVRDISVQQAESQLRALLAAEYGEDFQLIVWEGSIYEKSDFLEEVRSTVNTFSVIISLLGFVLLLAYLPRSTPLMI